MLAGSDKLAFKGLVLHSLTPNSNVVGDASNDLEKSASSQGAEIGRLCVSKCLSGAIVVTAQRADVTHILISPDYIAQLRLNQYSPSPRQSFSPSARMSPPVRARSPRHHNST